MLENIKSYCISGCRIEARQRRNNTSVIRCKGTFKAMHTPEIPFILDIYKDKTRLLFPTSEARKAADYYGVREYLKELYRGGVNNEEDNQ